MCRKEKILSFRLRPYEFKQLKITSQKLGYKTVSGYLRSILKLNLPFNQTVTKKK